MAFTSVKREDDLTSILRILATDVDIVKATHVDDPVSSFDLTLDTPRPPATPPANAPQNARGLALAPRQLSTTLTAKLKKQQEAETLVREAMVDYLRGKGTGWVSVQRASDRVEARVAAAGGRAAWRLVAHTHGKVGHSQCGPVVWVPLLHFGPCLAYAFLIREGKRGRYVACDPKVRAVRTQH